jgi:hypothetical protein
VFVCRALKAHLEAAGFSSAMAAAGVLPAVLSAEQKAVSAQVETALELAVLPGMSLIPSNPAACSEVRPCKQIPWFLTFEQSADIHQHPNLT